MTMPNAGDGGSTTAAASTRSAAPSPPVAPNVFTRAMRGGSYLFLQKIFTFAINSFVLRKLQLSITGAVTVRLELALATIFLLRDGIRLAFLRMPSIDSSYQEEVTQKSLSESALVNGKSLMKPTQTTTAAYVQQLVNVGWLSTAVSWCVAIISIFLTATEWMEHASPSSSSNVEGLQDYSLVMAMYCLAAMVEALAEPMYVLAHCSVLVSWQVAAQGAGFLVRGIVQYVCIFLLDWGLLSYGCAELAYASTLLLVFITFFWRRIYSSNQRLQQSKSPTFALHSMTQLLPHRPPSTDISSTHSRWFHPQLLSLLFPLSLQSSVKYLLSEGDKWVLSLAASFQDMGVYGIVFHLGSLVPRIVFLPIEEATKTIFSKMANSSSNSNTADKEESRRLMMMLLKLMNLIGLCFVCFGTTYAQTLILLLYGVEKARLGVAEALSVYCIYIHFLGLNGICEAFVHAVGNEMQLMRLNKLMGIFFVIYVLSAVIFMSVFQLGTIGIVLANCVNMGCRILYCLSFMTSFFASKDQSETETTKQTITKRVVVFWRQSLPDRLVLLAFISSFLVTMSSKLIVLKGQNKTESWKHHVVHVAIGAVCFIGVMLTLYMKERRLLRSELAALRRQKVSAEVKAHGD